MTTIRPQASRTAEESFIKRHIGPSAEETQAMLAVLGYSSLDAFIDATVPAGIRMQRPLETGEARSEHEALNALRAVAAKNQRFRSFIGMGYHDTLIPPVVQRNVLENPAWYTAYTPYQAEIAQGRLEALLNFQTVVIDLTGLEIANASLLDEGTAAAEAMTLVRRANRSATGPFVVDANALPQTIAVVRTRAEAIIRSAAAAGVSGRMSQFNFGSSMVLVR